ncbi:MAG: hypothetical protein KDE34_11860, partial [Anaerolineales bacterium]|nr:hypothetical protein [Anaerolineales bacterium]
DEQIEATLTQLRQKKAELMARLPEAPGTIYRAKVKGSGAVAQGPGATAVGERGVSVGGSVGGSIVTGDRNRITSVGGDVVKGDKVGGDKVGGDKITTGDISGSTGVAIGREAQAHVQYGVSGAELTTLFQAMYEKIDARTPDPNVEKEEIVAEVQKIEAEATTQAEPNENKLERWIRNLVHMAPDIVDVMAASLAGPVTGAMAVLKKIVARVKNESEK